MERNKLIKRKGLFEILRKENLNALNKKAIKEVEKFLKDETHQLAQIVKQRMLIKGKKIVQKEDILECIEEIRKLREEDYEI